DIAKCRARNPPPKLQQLLDEQPFEIELQSEVRGVPLIAPPIFRRNHRERRRRRENAVELLAGAVALTPEELFFVAERKLAAVPFFRAYRRQRHIEIAIRLDLFRG